MTVAVAVTVTADGCTEALPSLKLLYWPSVVDCIGPGKL